jgi:hypothetical protein
MMAARIPRAWATAFHPQAARRTQSKLTWQPGVQGTGQQPMQRVPVQAYTGRISGVPLTGGQAQGIIPTGGKVTLSVGPQGAGTVWHPAQVTLSTTTGLNGELDTSSAVAYLGSQGVPITQVGGPLFGGNGVMALAIPPMSPGQLLIVVWTNGHVGDTAAFNVIGTMDALTTGPSR